jgi:hypothetical protein
VGHARIQYVAARREAVEHHPLCGGGSAGPGWAGPAPQLASAGLGVAVTPVSAVGGGVAGAVRSFSPCLSIGSIGLPAGVAGVEHDEVDDAVAETSVADDLAEDSAVLRMKARRIREEVQRTRQLLRQRRHRQDPRLLRQESVETGHGDRDDPTDRVGGEGRTRLNGGSSDDHTGTGARPLLDPDTVSCRVLAGSSVERAAPSAGPTGEPLAGWRERPVPP